MKDVIRTCTAILLCAFYAHGQQIPDYTTTDNYLPYLKEMDKQEQITKNYLNLIQKKYPHTIQNLYPQLQPTQLVTLPSGAPGMPADLPNGMHVTVPMTSKSSQDYSMLHSDPLASNIQRNQQIIDKDINDYNQRSERENAIISEALKTLYKPEIVYQLGLHGGERVTQFLNASSLLQSMLDGTQKTDFLRAVFAIESAVDKTLTWSEFNSMFQKDLRTIGTLMQNEKLSPDDNLAKVMTIYRFMTDTTKVFDASNERTITTKPMLYDYEDYEAKKDLTKVFVSKLLRTGSGQCMSLPMLFFLYAKAMNADVNLVFAPDHSYITFKDNNANQQNIELTGKMFTTTDFYWQSGFIKAEQVKSGIYLHPLTDKEVLVHLLTTLARAYAKTFGTDDRLLEMAIISKRYAPNDLSANMLMLGYKRDLYRHILRQYDVFELPKEDFENDENRKRIESEMYAAYDNLKKNLGYAKMPDWAYRKWLDGVNAAAQKQQHIVKKRELEQQLNK